MSGNCVILWRGGEPVGYPGFGEHRLESQEEPAMTSTVQGVFLVQRQAEQEQALTVGTGAWFAWLETASTFAFVSKAGTFTARRERAGHKRGGWYWKAYRKQQGKLSSSYLGKSEVLTLDRLNAAAQTLAQLAVRDAKAKADEEAPPPAPASKQGDPLTSLLATKLHIPRPRPHLVLRPHLVEQLQQGMERALTLVSAPAGFGKTTLLAQWLAGSGTPAAWGSLGLEDNDPTSFLSYLIAALQTLDAQTGITALAMLRTLERPSPETVIAVLTNDLAGSEGDFALVLDDYHVIADESIQRGMTFLLEHLPPQLHPILVGRADSHLPLARLRAQGQLCEVRTADLRFGAAEVSAFLQAVMVLDLPTEAIAILERRTEGWIAGLQPPALSLRGQADVPGFLTAFSGSHRYVLDYLNEQELARQPAVVQQFLLHTCILERLSGLLCDAVTERTGSQGMLEALEQATLFVVSLDDERRWDRYHHLFAELLRNHLHQPSPPFA